MAAASAVLLGLRVALSPPPAPAISDDPTSAAASQGRMEAAAIDAKMAWRGKHGRRMVIAGAVTASLGWMLQMGSHVADVALRPRSRGCSPPDQWHEGCYAGDYALVALSTPGVTLPAATVGIVGAEYWGEFRAYSVPGSVEMRARRLVVGGSIATGVGIGLLALGVASPFIFACVNSDHDAERRCDRVSGALEIGGTGAGVLGIVAGGMTWAHGAGLRRGMGRRTERGPSAHWGLAPWIGATPGMAVHGRF